MKFPNIYPDPECRRLRGMLSDYVGVPAENLLVGCGADELIDLLMRCVLDPGDTIVDTPPTFTMYAFDADVNAARTVQVPRLEGFKLDIDGICEAVIENDAKIVFVTSPNNPDGRATSARMDQSHAELRIHDHVYNWPSFVTAHTSPSSSDWPLRNAVMIFSLSKLTGHAGTRFGWALVAKFDVAKAMATHVWLKSGGPPGVESQMRAASIIRRVTQSVGTSNDFFEWVHTEMSNRYTVLESIFEGQQKFALLSERGSACAWLRCPPHGDTCANRLRKVGIVSAEGENFGADSAHARVCVASHRSSFDIVARRLDMLVRQEQDREYERWQCPDCPFNFD